MHLTTSNIGSSSLQAAVDADSGVTSRELAIEFVRKYPSRVSVVRLSTFYITSTGKL